MIRGSPALADTPLESYHGRVRSEIFPLVPDRAGRLLDVGGGLGHTARALVAAGKAAEAGVIDLVEAEAGPLGLAFHETATLEDHASVGAILAARGPFDTVLCLDVLEHVSDPWGLVALLHRHLAPGGAIVASIPNANNYRLVGPLVLRGRWDLEEEGIRDRTHLRWFVRETAVALMTSSGLVLEEVVRKPTPGRKVAAFRAASFGLLDRFTDLQFLIRVRDPG